MSVGINLRTMAKLNKANIIRTATTSNLGTLKTFVCYCAKITFLSLYATNLHTLWEGSVVVQGAG